MKKERFSQDSIASCEKLNTNHDPVACRSTFSCNILKQWSSISLNQSLIFLWRNFGQAWLSDSCLSFDSWMFWYTEEFIVDLNTAKRPGPVAVKQNQTITPPPLCLTAGVRHLCFYCVWFSPYMTLCIDTSPLWFHLPKSLCSRRLDLDLTLHFCDHLYHFYKKYAFIKIYNFLVGMYCTYFFIEVHRAC